MNENAMKGLQEFRQKVAAGEIEVVQLNPIEKLKENPTSLRLAINAMCYSCMGGTATSKSNNTRGDIRGCTAIDCALYNVRPYK